MAIPSTTQVLMDGTTHAVVKALITGTSVVDVITFDDLDGMGSKDYADIEDVQFMIAHDKTCTFSFSDGTATEVIAYVSGAGEFHHKEHGTILHALQSSTIKNSVGSIKITAQNSASTNSTLVFRLRKQIQG